MKQLLPYNVLLIIAVALTGAVVLYNLALREPFAVTVAYAFPAAPKAAGTPEQNSVAEATGNNNNNGVDYESPEYDENTAITGVTFPLDLNTATEEELRFIPQVGDVMSQRIVQYRDVLGRYESLDQLKDIKGVGDATFKTISAYLIINIDEADENN